MPAETNADLAERLDYIADLLAARAGELRGDVDRLAARVDRLADDVDRLEQLERGRP